MLVQVIASCLLHIAQALHNAADSSLSCGTVQGGAIAF
jgi:hypothetical protein